MPELKQIEVRGAREHNLKSIAYRKFPAAA